MRKIYVLDENNELKEIDAGITQYSELQDAPIYTTYKGIPLVNSTVELVEGNLVVTSVASHKWTDEELLLFCDNAVDGRYDIFTNAQGHEILIIDSTIEKLGRRYRRIGVDQDQIYDLEANRWLPITDTTAKNLIYQFLNESEIKDSIVVGDPLVLKFYYYSNIGTARVTVTMNGTAFTVGTVGSGENIDVDLTKYVVDGPNVISVKFTNDATSMFVPELNIKGINITYTPEFNQYKNFSESVIFDYSCNGSSDKVVHFDITNARGEKNHYQMSHGSGYIGGAAALPAEFFSKGENHIATYMQAVDENGNEITKTIITNYRIPFLTDDEPLLMVYFDNWEGLKQYASISIPYYVWCRQANSLSKIKFAIESPAMNSGKVEYEYSDIETGAITNYLQYNAKHTWLISNLPTSFKDKVDMKAAFSIVGYYNPTIVEEETIYNETNKFVKDNVTIVSSDDKMQTVAGYKFNFAAADLVQGKAIESWSSTGSEQKNMILNGFNWNTDGVMMDDEGNQSLHFASAASAVLSEGSNPVFGSYNQRYTLELSFKVSSSASENVIAKYYNPNATNPDAYGLFIYPNKAVFKYSGGQSEINYLAGERTHLAYVICNKTVTDEDLDNGGSKTSDLLYLFVYLNGILSQMKPIATNVSFPSDCGTMAFNTNHNEFDLYVFRGYSTSLTSAQVLQNYIATFGDATKKEQLYLANNLYNGDKSTGVQGEFEIDFNSVKGKIPCYVMVCDVLPRTKNYVDVLGIYYEKDGETLVEPGGIVKKLDNRDITGIPKATTYYYHRKATDYDESGKPIAFTSWERAKPIEVGGQGTSSLAYPRHNFKFKHDKKNKFYIKGHVGGPDRTFTFKADYMDSSGANNIGNAQILDNAIVREKWVETPVAKDPNLRVNLDGFPVAVFWCKSVDGLKAGVKQDEKATDVFDADGNQLFDAVTPNVDNPLVGEVTPENPKYIGTFNFNYDKKAKELLGWDEDIFQGFEFRGNSSSCNLFRGFENFAAFTSLGEGFEWRWTYCSDNIDDFHDGHLNLTIDGGYFDEEVKKKYTEEDYLADRYAAKPKEAAWLDPYNRFYIERDGKQYQLMLQQEDGSYKPINYITINPNNEKWNLTDYAGISKDDVCLEYGVKFAVKDGVESFVYQLPYGISKDEPLGLAYPDGSHYYKFDWNPEHEFKFEYNDTQEYFTNIDNWTALAPMNKVKAMKITYTENSDGAYIFDNTDDEYHEMNLYPEGVDFTEVKDDKPLFGARYDKNVEYLEVKLTDKIITWDYMKHIFKNWCYVNEAVAHCDATNYRAVLDSQSTWGNNGKGLFVWDALTNYMAASIITGLCDNFAKNMFMHSYDEGISWSPAWYDMDTCFGLNNEGAYTKMYDVDFMDFDTTGARAFNGSDSKLWELIYNNSFDELQTMYQYLRTNNYINYEKIMDVIDKGNIAYKAASLYNANAVFRYMEPLAWHSNTKTDAAQGSRLPLLKYWNKNRNTFLDSRYEGPGWTNDRINLRLNNSETVTFKLVPDTNMFLGANYNSDNATVPSVKSTTKILAGQTWETTRGPSTNLNTYLYGASHLLEVGDLSLCNSTEYSVSTAVNLKELKIGDEVHPPIVSTILTLSKGEPYRNLTLLDLTKVNLKDTNLNLTSGETNIMPALQTLKLKGSNVEYLTLGSYTPIQTLSLPDNLRRIDLYDLLNLNNLQVYGTNNVELLRVSNCPSVNQLQIARSLKGKLDVLVSLDNLYCDESNAITMEEIKWLAIVADPNRSLKINDTLTYYGKLAGSVYVESIADSDLDTYRAIWPELEINLKQIYAKEVIFGITGEGGLDE